MKIELTGNYELKVGAEEAGNHYFLVFMKDKERAETNN